MLSADSLMGLVDPMSSMESPSHVKERLSSNSGTGGFGGFLLDGEAVPLENSDTQGVGFNDAEFNFSVEGEVVPWAVSVLKDVGLIVDKLIGSRVVGSLVLFPVRILL